MFFSLRFFQDSVKRPREEKWEIDGHVDRDVWLEAGRQGLLLVDTPVRVNL